MVYEVITTFSQKTFKKALEPRTSVNQAANWWDGHGHFFDVANPESALKKMRDLGVVGAVSCGVDESSNQKALMQQKKFEIIRAAIGLHPETVLSNSEKQNQNCISFVKKNISMAAGFGEIGLDFKYANSLEKQQKQKKYFEELLSLAAESEKPVFVHSRRAVDETIGAIEKFGLKKVLIHWFDGTPEQLTRIERNGWLVSVGPAVFSQKKIQKIAATVDLGRLVLETDCPIPFDGVPSDPSWIPSVGEKVAELRSENLEKIREITSQNTQNLLNFY